MGEMLAVFKDGGARVWVVEGARITSGDGEGPNAFCQLEGSLPRSSASTTNGQTESFHVDMGVYREI